MRTRSGSKYAADGSQPSQQIKPQINSEVKPKPTPKSPKIGKQSPKTSKTAQKSTKKAIDSVVKPKKANIVTQEEVKTESPVKEVRRGRSQAVKSPEKEVQKPSEKEVSKPSEKTIPKTRAKAVSKTPEKAVPKATEKTAPKSRTKAVPKPREKPVPKTPEKVVSKTPEKTVSKSPAKEVPKTEIRTRSTRSSRQPINELTETKKIEVKTAEKVVKGKNTRAKTNLKKVIEEKVIEETEEIADESDKQTEELVKEEDNTDVKSIPKNATKATKKVVKPKTRKKTIKEDNIEEVVEKPTIEEPIDTQKSPIDTHNEVELENADEPEEVEISGEVGEPVVVDEPKAVEELEKEKVIDLTENELIELEEEEEEEDDDVLEIIEDKMETDETESFSLKRKNDEKDVTPEPETIKRMRLSRFDVPPVPQTFGQLFSFGTEIAGELGLRLKKIDGTKVRPNEPSIVTDRDGQPFDKVVDVVCGAMHSICLTSEGKVFTFGCNDDSALGRDTQIRTLDDTDDDIDESEEKEARTPNQVMGVPEVVKLTAGDMHSCALTKDGSVFVWGNFKDESKKLGLFVESLMSDKSDDYMPTSLPTRVESEAKIVDIASGCHHILLLSDEGEVLSFGEGSKGQLGRIDSDQLQSITSDRKLFLEPQKVNFGEGVVVEKVWANHWSSYAKTTSGDIYSWGLNNYHQLGFRSSGFVELLNTDPNESQQNQKFIIELKPTKVDKMEKNIVMIANGQHHMLALSSDGQVFSCGSDTYGKLGYAADNSNDPTVDSPRAISGEAFDSQSVSYIAAGEFCSLAVTESGHLYAWGQGSSHIGSEDFNDILVPTRVKGLLADNNRFSCVSSGSQHTLLVGNKSTVNGN